WSFAVSVLRSIGVSAPVEAESGPDSFPYQITDVNGATASSLVNITVTPTASPDSASTGAETPIDLSTLTANDQGTSLVVTSATQPAHGTTTVTNGVVTYTPAAGYVGPDSFDYTATDGSSLHQTVTSTVSITVSPGAADDTATTTAGTPVTTAVLTANDHGSLTAQSITQPSHGTAVLNPDGTATYTPDAGYSGPDSFTYTATDGGSTSSTANVNITVTPAIADADPTTTIDTPITVDAAHGLLSTAHGSGLTATKTTSPAHGSVVVNADGSYTYTPDPGFIGTDSFGFSVTDSSNQTVTGQASIDVVALTPALAHTGLDGSLVGTITGGGVGALLLGLGLLAFGLLSRSPRTRRHRAVR
ncbi:Ig-like domain-containing protein, partial [Mesorhizobium japonicum]|uniref:Ig-like domain-containing protein n=1 Tax=Mesorhizobium japonicum TaxID=2066070 RepID=UPI003B5CFE4F